MILCPQYNGVNSGKSAYLQSEDSLVDVSGTISASTRSRCFMMSKSLSQLQRNMYMICGMSR